jgi:hypothetical protein
MGDEENTGVIGQLDKGVRAALYDKLGNPYLRSLFVSLAICNWDFLLILCFGSESMESKVEAVKVAWTWPITGDQAWAATHRFLFPLLFAWIWTRIVPGLTWRMFNRGWHVNLSEHRNTKNAILDTETLDQPRAAKLRRQLRESGAENSAKDDVIAQLRSSAAETEENIHRLKIDIEDLEQSKRTIDESVVKVVQTQDQKDEEIRELRSKLSAHTKASPTERHLWEWALKFIERADRTIKLSGPDTAKLDELMGYLRLHSRITENQDRFQFADLLHGELEDSKKNMDSSLTSAAWSLMERFSAWLRPRVE